jgi:hypothetical protein
MTETPVPGPVPRFELAPWREFGVVAGITGRGSGSPPFDLGLAGSSTPVGVVMNNWRRLRQCFPNFQSVVLARQNHGTAIRWHTGGIGLVIQDDLDGHATDRPGCLVAVTVADCIPVYIADPVRRQVCLLHAGWKGIAAGILAAGLAEMEAQGSSVDNLLIHCGIGICGRCYQVGSEVFVACGLAPPEDGKGWLDLREVLIRQARQAGVSHLSVSPFCSAHDADRFFSHRASGGADGRMVAYLGLVA